MKRIAAFILLVAFSVAVATPVLARDTTAQDPSQSRGAAKTRQKTMKKRAKQQRREMKRSQKELRKEQKALHQAG